MRSFSRVVVVLALAVAACGAPSGPPPILSLDGRLCVPQPDLISAPLLPMDQLAKVTLDGAAPCWDRGKDGKSVYIVYQLPQSPEPYIITVGSLPLGQGLFLPQLLLLTPRGETTRTLQSESFQFHNSALAAGIRVHADEGYLIVASNPHAVGLMVSRINDTVSVTGGRIQIYTGAETVNNYVYAYNGLVTISARPVPKVN